MAAYLWPGFPVQEFRWGQRALSMSNLSPFNNRTQSTELAGAQWTASLTFSGAASNTAIDERGPLEGFLMRVGGVHNAITMWHIRRPVPKGTMRGSPTLAGSAAQLAKTLTIQTTAGATLLGGDLFGCAGQLFMAAANATANGSGVMTVTLAIPVRNALSSGTAIVWSKPTTNFIFASQVQIPYQTGYAPSFSIDLVETF